MGGRLRGAPAAVRYRPARHADRGRRPGLRAGGHGAALRARRRHGRRPVVEGLCRRPRGRGPAVGDGRGAARRGRPADLPRRRRAGGEGDRVRQAHRRGGVARALVRLGPGLQRAHRLRRRRRPAAHRLASACDHVARSPHGRAVLGGSVRRPARRDHRDAGAGRSLPAGLVLLQRVADAAPEPRPSGRHRSSGAARRATRSTPTSSTR